MRINRRKRLVKEKVKNTADLERIISVLKRSRLRVVFTNGCFDILHAGHVAYLEEAARLGDILVVGVNSDASVRRIKGGKRPIVKQSQRLILLAGLESVDFVTIFNEDTPLKLIGRLKPDVLVKGADWDKSRIAGAELVLASGGRVRTVKLTKGLSTSGIIKKIAELY